MKNPEIKKGVASYHIMIISGMCEHMKDRYWHEFVHTGLASAAHAIDENDVPGAMAILDKCYAVAIEQLNKEGISYSDVQNRLGNDLKFLRRVDEGIRELGYDVLELQHELARQEQEQHILSTQKKAEAQLEMGINVKDVGSC